MASRARVGLVGILGLVLAHASCHADTPPAPPPPPPPPPSWGSPGPIAPPAPLAAPPCQPEGSYACTPDRTSMLQCRLGRFVIASTCRGARGCAEGAAVACDASSAAPGDPCDSPGASACGGDRRTFLRCVNGAFAADSICRNACLATSGKVLCQ